MRRFDNDRNAAKLSYGRGKQAGAEHMRMKHVDLLLSQSPRQPDRAANIGKVVEHNGSYADIVRNVVPVFPEKHIRTSQMKPKETTIQPAQQLKDVLLGTSSHNGA